MERKFLQQVDPQIEEIIENEENRQARTLMMIPSENHASFAVKEAVGSILQDKYCEGYPYKRYYRGQENFDKLETLCQERAKKIFNVPYVNVQALSGTPANLAVYFSVLKPGDKIMALRLDQGGHISHGFKKNISGQIFEPIFYHLDKNGRIDYKAMAEMAKKEKPKMIIASTTAYPLSLDFKHFAEIADSINSYLLADISHIVGLVIAGVHPNPVPYCHIITTTTHKTLRGARGALIMATRKGLDKDPELPQKINRTVFPGLQGGPHENSIAGIAVALKEAMQQQFKEYGQQIVKNASCLAENLKKGGIKLCSNGTEIHLILVDLRPFNISGKTIAEALEKASIIVNRNSIPNDPGSPFYPSGVRLGTPGITSRGMKEPEMQLIASLITRVIKDISRIKKEMNFSSENEKKIITRQEIISQSQEVKRVKKQVEVLCSKFPIKKRY